MLNIKILAERKFYKTNSLMMTYVANKSLFNFCILKPSFYLKRLFDDIQIVSCVSILQCLNCTSSRLRKLEIKILKDDHHNKEGAAERIWKEI